MAKNNLDEKALAGSAAITSALLMLVLGVFANIGIYRGAAEMMRSAHMAFSFSFLGILSGMIEAAIVAYIIAWIFARIYNKLI